MSVAIDIFTEEALDWIPDDARCREIIGGEPHVSPASAEDCQHLSMRLSHLLYEEMNVSGAGKTQVSPFDV